MDSFVNGVIMMVLGVMGLVPLLFVVLRLLLIPHRLHPFHYLILSKLAADGIEMLVPLMALSASQLLFGNWLHKENTPIAGYLALSLQYSSIYSSVAMTVNRLFAVTCPRQYNKWFNRQRTVMYIVACWVLAWTHNAIHLKDGCTFTFNPEVCQFKFSDEQCGHTLSLFQDLIYNITIAVVTTLVDIYCLLKLNYTKEVYTIGCETEKLNCHGKSTCDAVEKPNTSSMTSLTCRRKVVAYSVDRKKREKPWFLQTTSNSLMYVLMLASFHAAVFFEGATIRFLLTVVTWQMWLASAPIIIICADKEYRTSPRSLWKAWTKSEVTTAF